MKTFLGIISVTVLLLALHSSAVAQTNSTDVLEQTVLDYKARIDNCLASLAKKDNSAEERGAAAFSVSFLLEACDQFVAGSNAFQQQKLKGDAEFTGKLCALHIAFAEYQLEEAKIDANPPSVNALEKAFKQYQLAVACLNALSNRETIARNGKWIELGLGRTISGLNKYADWFAKDAFMNPEGKKWEANPVALAEKLRTDISGKSSSSGELATCEKAFERVMKDIQRAVERGDSKAALENMILGARWLTTILQKSPETFVNDFHNYNTVTRTAMEEVKKGYSSERMTEFSRFYEPLKSHYLALTTGKK